MELTYNQGDLVRVRDPKYDKFGGLLMGSVLFTGSSVKELNENAKKYESGIKLTYKNVLRGFRKVVYYDVPLFASGTDLDNYELQLFPREHIAVHIFDKKYLGENYKTTSRIIILPMNAVELLPYQRNELLVERETGCKYKIIKVINRFEATKFKKATDEVIIKLQPIVGEAPMVAKNVNYLDLMADFDFI